MRIIKIRATTINDKKEDEANKHVDNERNNEKMNNIGEKDECRRTITIMKITTEETKIIKRTTKT